MFHEKFFYFINRLYIKPIHVTYTKTCDFIYLPNSTFKKMLLLLFLKISKGFVYFLNYFKIFVFHINIFLNKHFFDDFRNFEKLRFFWHFFKAVLHLTDTRITLLLCARYCTIFKVNFFLNLFVNGKNCHIMRSLLFFLFHLFTL